MIQIPNQQGRALSRLVLTKYWYRNLAGIISLALNEWQVKIYYYVKLVGPKVNIPYIWHRDSPSIIQCWLLKFTVSFNPGELRSRRRLKATMRLQPSIVTSSAKNKTQITLSICWSHCTFRFSDLSSSLAEKMGSWRDSNIDLLLTTLQLKHWANQATPRGW